MLCSGCHLSPLLPKAHKTRRSSSFARRRRRYKQTEIRGKPKASVSGLRLLFSTLKSFGRFFCLSPPSTSSHSSIDEISALGLQTGAGEVFSDLCVKELDGETCAQPFSGVTTFWGDDFEAYTVRGRALMKKLNPPCSNPVIALLECGAVCSCACFPER